MAEDVTALIRRESHLPLVVLAMTLALESRHFCARRVFIWLMLWFELIIEVCNFYHQKSRERVYKVSHAD